MANVHAVASGTDVPVVTTAETVIATSNAFSVSNPQGQGIRVSGVINFTTGTSTTAVTIRVRRDTLTGTLVGEAQTHTIGAAITANLPFDQVDALLSATNQVYVATIQQTAASANGTGNSWTIGCQSATAVE